MKNLSASLTSERHGWLQEKHSVLAEKDAIQMALMSEQSTVKVLQQEQAEWHKKHQALLSEKNELIGNTMEQNEYWATKVIQATRHTLLRVMQFVFWKDEKVSYSSSFNLISNR